MRISASLQACGVVFPFAMLTSICRSIVTICSGLYLLIGMASFSSQWSLSHSTWYKLRRSRHFLLAFQIGRLSHEEAQHFYRRYDLPVFISYSHEDATFAHKLGVHLVRNNAH